MTGDRWRQADIPISGKPARPNSEPKNVRGRSVGIHPSSLRFVEVLVFVLVWNNKKRMYIYIYRYIICAHMYVYEYIMLNNRKKTLLAQPKRRISEARKGTCVTYLMSVWRFRMPTMVGKVNPPTDQNECQHDRFGLGESFPVLKSFI